VNTEEQQGEGDERLEQLLEYLREARGFDFTGYKRPILTRRIQKRMSEVGLDDYPDYTDHLEANPREFTELFNTILINVTGFFRDKPAWDYLQSQTIPALIAEISDDQAIRVWSAGCASGEEAYTIAMVLLEAIGEEEFKRRVKIYATDVDEEALSTARVAAYPSKSFEDMDPELLERYFVENGRGYSFRPDLRRSVIFGRNELLEDAPISRIDLLVCRNVLMYFTPESQGRIVSRFNFALRDHGYLFLGKAEMLVRHTDYFAPVDVKARVFQRVPGVGIRDRIAVLGEAAAIGTAGGGRAELREAAAAIGPVARLVVDQNRFLIEANESARVMFNLGPADLGRPLQDLEVSYRPLDLRSPLDQAYEQNRRVQAGRVTLNDGADGRVLDVEVEPVLGREGGVLGAAISFTDVTEMVRLATEHGESKRQLETAYEELQSTVEELETTNEELQSTNEELETTNEELQSANEELQTMNEELTSTNDELQVMTEEQREHSFELDRLNLFLEGILGNLGVAVAVVDRERRVQLWNGASEDLWGLRGDEVQEQDLLSLDFGLPVAELQEPVAKAIDSPEEASDLTLPAINRRGRSFDCHVRVMGLVAPASGVYGAIILMRADGATASV
jgi:two-component system CheB/CheR fusion protein